jgi:hypothetical protein
MSAHMTRRLHSGLWRFDKRFAHPDSGVPFYLFRNEHAPPNCRKFAIPIAHFWGDALISAYEKGT